MTENPQCLHCRCMSHKLASEILNVPDTCILRHYVVHASAHQGRQLEDASHGFMTSHLHTEPGFKRLGLAHQWVSSSVWWSVAREQSDIFSVMRSSGHTVPWRRMKTCHRPRGATGGQHGSLTVFTALRQDIQEGFLMPRLSICFAFILENTGYVEEEEEQEIKCED